jgi:toxin YhaV
MDDRRPEGNRNRRQLQRRSAAAATGDVVVVNGWTLLAHPLFLEAMESVVARVEADRAREAEAATGYAVLLANLLDLVFEKIPANPANPAFRHGGAVAGGRREWFRAKTGNGRYRLFFRYHSVAKVIVYAWVNDERTLRTYGSRTDAYAVFAGMLQDGNPPEDWDGLVAAADSPAVRNRLSALRYRAED